MGTHPIFESDFDCITVMELLEPLKWDCIEWTGNQGRSIIVNQSLQSNNIGEVIHTNGREGIYLASSQLGITIFDLFSEILEEADLRQFLIEHHVETSMFKDMSALILRAFLLLVDLNKQPESMLIKGKLVLNFLMKSFIELLRTSVCTSA